MSWRALALGLGPLTPAPTVHVQSPSAMAAQSLASAFSGVSLRTPAKVKATRKVASVTVAPRAALEARRHATPYDGFK